MASAIVIVIAAMASVAFGVLLVAHAREFLAHHRATGGVVTAVNSDVVCGVAGGTCLFIYDMTIRYQPPGNGLLVFIAKSESTRIPVGTHVVVYYLESDPRDARLDPGTGEQVGGIVLIAAGLAGLAIGYRRYRAPVRGRR